MAEVKFSKWDFNFYCHLLHKISVVNSKCSVLNSRLLKNYIEIHFHVIEFRYNLSIRVIFLFN